MTKRFMLVLAALALVGACGGGGPTDPGDSGGGGGPSPTETMVTLARATPAHNVTYGYTMFIFLDLKVFISQDTAGACPVKCPATGCIFFAGGDLSQDGRTVTYGSGGQQIGFGQPDVIGKLLDGRGVIDLRGYKTGVSRTDYIVFWIECSDGLSGTSPTPIIWRSTPFPYEFTFAPN